MTYRAFAHRLPAPISNALFGDRKRFGPLPDRADPTWIEWQSTYYNFYTANQRSTVGGMVNRAGYRIVADVDLRGKTVLEIGPADIEHLEHWSGKPSRWVNLDVSSNLLRVAAEKLDAAGIEHEEVLTQPGGESRLPFGDASFDVVITFYALEHIYPLDAHLAEIRRILKPGGLLVGAIPSEGGLAWGAGRYVTSRRWLLRHTGIDPNRLICWEHPNFADFILNRLEAAFERRVVRFWPLPVPVLDINLVASFVFARSN